MKKGIALGNDSVIARSLKVTNATFLMVGSITTLMAADAMVTLSALNVLGQATILGITFAFGLVIASALVTDLLLRSNQNVATLRSLGATQGAVCRSILASILIFGGAGTILGVALGAGLGVGLSSFGSAGAVGLEVSLTDAVLVFVLTLSAVVSGVFLGVVRSWRS